MADTPDVHIPVLASEVVTLLGGRAPTLSASEWIVDGTLGAGGHTTSLLQARPDLCVLGADQDPEILALARQNLEPFGGRARLVRARLSNLARLVRKLRRERPIGWLMDVGASSLQLDRPSRGFSFQKDGPLDMRMDPRRRITAADIINDWDEGELADLFWREGDEHRSRPIAAAIVAARKRVPFKRTAALADLVADVAGGAGRLHPATKVFQALRREVNQEGAELMAGLQGAEDCLAEGGVLAVIAFHSGEDAVVKHFLAEGAKAGRWELLTKKPIKPGREELRRNVRARSAVLRGARRLGPVSQPGPQPNPNTP
ncbi:MAG: 16S rRNA (cytosine(1402)-N(4))-methyltransferase RsmH [Planctomycetota bacterium]